MNYVAPVRAMAFALDAVADLSENIRTGMHERADADTIQSVLDEAGTFAGEILSPLNRQGDLVGACLKDGHVTLPAGWRQAYTAWRDAGWNAIDLPEQWGGMGLPTRLAAACMEMWTSACMSFALGPVLTQGASEALLFHADEAIKALYLPKLVSGEWSATMNLTEPQAGSDLGALRTKAVPVGDGTYRITGQKIFITYGEHDLTDNIVHLVLARLPDAPAGTKGISLFLVPKFLPDAEGGIGRRNDVTCTRLEEKLGIHASPTCAMSFGENGGALGWLVGKENEGLACMFTMMNRARLYTGIQGVAVAERAYQQALAFAKLRRQGRAPGASQACPIIEHPDVRRNLMTMKALTAASRAIAYAAAAAIEQAEHGSVALREEAAARAGLLTPLTKAFCSEVGVEVASIGLQVHGGMGYVEETGAAQLYRDARITPIYEGTNGIQAIDLVTRKLPRGQTAATLFDEYEGYGRAAEKHADPLLGRTGAAVCEAVTDLRRASAYFLQAETSMEDRLAVATPYLRLFAVTAGAAYLAKGALTAAERLKQDRHNSFLQDEIATARFFAETMAVQSFGLARAVMNGAGVLKTGCVSDFACF
ncbi:acyl-CoA dehydrogenase [Bradyrhizobium manausense]|uniref:acyl-CoA dehydrogenase n=1 Tax=Bradyrhizobium TaxID=374 RepID=UPI001BAB07D1|nr:MULTISPECIES: acyl-CoA dehydrogenase [Bradyrhizobium]MBR0830256.1 acyl-CoA dehydrogenase [Bradyrhizobium manausense]UVO31560.1 acyl-CoA dehydrogenase [Bradyrhizobium arachidis]